MNKAPGGGGLGRDLSVSSETERKTSPGGGGSGKHLSSESDLPAPFHTSSSYRTNLNVGYGGTVKKVPVIGEKLA